MDELVLALALGRGVHDVHCCAIAVALDAFGMDRHRLGLHVTDPLTPVHRSQRELDIGDTHVAHADPDVARDPVPVAVGRDNDDFMAAREQPPQVQSGRVPGYAGSQDDGA